MSELNKTYLAVALFGLSGGMLAVSMPLFLAQAGFSLPDIGVLLGVAALIGGLIGILLGAHSDVVGRKGIISFISLVSSLSSFILVLFKNIPSIIASQAGARFTGNVSWNLLLSRLTDLTKEAERGRHIGYFSAAFAFAYALGNLLGGVLYSNYGPDGVFLTTSWIALCAALLIYFTFSDTQPKKEKHQLSLSLLKTKNGIANSAISFFTGTQSITYGYAIYLFFASEYSFSPEQIGTLVGFLFGIWAVSTFLLGRISDRFGTVRTFAAGGFLNSAVWVLAAFFQQWELFLALMILDNVVYPLYGVNAAKLSSIIAHKENLGRDIAVFGYFHLIGMVFGLLVAGPLAAISFSAVFLARAAGLSIPALIALKFINLKEEKAKP